MELSKLSVEIINNVFVNAVCPLSLNHHEIPLGIKGELTGFNLPMNTITLEWTINGKTIATTFSHDLFVSLVTKEMLIHDTDYAPEPKPLFDKGDLVYHPRFQEYSFVDTRRYNRAKDEWQYKLINIEWHFSDIDGRISYDIEESSLQKVTDAQGLLVSVGDKTYVFDIKEKMTEKNA